MFVPVHLKQALPDEELTAEVARKSVRLAGQMHLLHMSNVRTLPQEPQRTEITYVRIKMGLKMPVEEAQSLEYLGHLFGAALIASVGNGADMLLQVSLQSIGAFVLRVTNIASVRN